MPPEQPSTSTDEPPRMQRVAPVGGRLLIFLAAVLFVGSWTWYFRHNAIREAVLLVFLVPSPSHDVPAGGYHHP
jgi:hypothetical protein